MVHPTYRKTHLPKNLEKRKSRQSPPKEACRDCRPWQPLKELCEDGVCLSENPESFSTHEKLILRRENRDVVKGTGQSSYRDRKGRQRNRLEELPDGAHGPAEILSGEAEEEKKQSRAWERERRKMRRFLRGCLKDERFTRLQREALGLTLGGFERSDIARMMRKELPEVYVIIDGRKEKGKVIGGMDKKLKQKARLRGFEVPGDT